MHLDPEIVRFASLRVPRYTSYPTAVQFAAEVGPETYRAWLGELTPDTRLSVYLHVPFCKHLCFYCGCHTRAERNGDVVSAYAETLCAEIAAVARCLPERMRVGHIHWGGGTPTELGDTGLARVLGALNDAFDIEPGREHAIELDPRRLDVDMIRSLAGHGIDRVSLGVQTFDPVVQAAIGRLQPYDQVRRAVGWLRHAGIEAISFDLMYGLPHQTASSVEDTAGQAAMLRPRRISAFGYAHVPWMKKNQGAIHTSALPGPEARLEQMAAIRGVLLENGYVPVGFDHFALPEDSLARSARGGGLRRNFQGYTTDAAPALIGFGASAIGRLPSGYVQNSPDLRAYSLALSDGLLPVGRGRVLTAEDHTRAALIQDVLCRGAADLGDTVPEQIRRPALDQLSPFLRLGLVAYDGRDLRVTEEGWPFTRLIASAFDAYLAEKPSAHSLAV